jgi:hypothetical protein
VQSDCGLAKAEDFIEKTRGIDKLPFIEKLDGRDERRIEVTGEETPVIRLQIESRAETFHGSLRPMSPEVCKPEKAVRRRKAWGSPHRFPQVFDCRWIHFEGEEGSSEKKEAGSRIRLQSDERNQDPDGFLHLSESVVAPAQVQQGLGKLIRHADQAREKLHGFHVIPAFSRFYGALKQSFVVRCRGLLALAGEYSIPPDCFTNP